VLLVAAVAGRVPAESPSIDGVWRSQGYGNVFEIKGPTLHAFEVTNSTCVAGGTSAVVTTPVPGGTATWPLTISVGETFTQALMGRTPTITRIGENTQGVFSDILGRRLPNGWRFGLPNEVFRTPQGTTFDGPGIPPDAAVRVFADEDVAAGRDPGVARALEILRRK